MSNESNQPTPCEKVAMNMFSILFSVCSSEQTPYQTKFAIYKTLEKVFNDPNGPFQEDDEMNQLGEVMVNIMNKLVPQIKGEHMLNEIMGNAHLN